MELSTFIAIFSVAVIAGSIVAVVLSAFDDEPLDLDDVFDEEDF